MSKNKLYNVIASGVTQAEVSDTGVLAVKQLKHAQGTLYYLFELEIRAMRSIGPYVLMSHHASCFEQATANASLDQKSQYHYTGYFKHENGKDYRLHVFYDANDDWVCEPLLSVLTSENTYEPVECMDEEKAFGVFADISIHSLLKSLRARQSTLVTASQADYDALEVRARHLSEDIVNNIDDYLALITLQMKKLDEVIRYSNKPSTATSIKNFLEKLKKSALVMADVKANEALVKKVAITKKPSQKKAATKPVTKSRAVKTKHSKEKVKQAAVSDYLSDEGALSTVLDRIRHDFSASTRVHPGKLVQLLTSLDAELTQKECELDFGFCTATLQDLQSLSALKKEIVSAGVKLLQRSILDGHYHQAKELSQFYHCLPQGLLSICLFSNNHNMLDFLLTNNVFSVNQKNLIIGRESYNSMMDYCFKNHSEKTSKIDILSVLIKHGSSLMEIDRTSGLPFAAVLLLMKHPLTSAIDLIAKTTFDDPLFFKQLNEVLCVIRSQPHSGDELTHNIDLLLESNQRQISQLNSIKCIKNSAITSKVRHMASQGREVFGDDMIDQLLADPEVRSLTARVNTELARLLPLLQVSVRRQIQDAVSLNFDALKKGLASIKEFGPLLTFDDIKKQCLKQNVTSLRLIQLRIELVAVQENIIKGKNVPFYNKNQVKQFNKLLLVERELVRDITKIGEELKEPFTFLDNFESIKSSLSSVIKSLQDMTESTNGLLGMLSMFGSNSNSGSDDELGDVDINEIEQSMSALLKLLGNK
tara:strand:- start:3170 stop:5455 length:2286 start_codon:yes stop_codon:yes gene_type:complete